LFLRTLSPFTFSFLDFPRSVQIVSWAKSISPLPLVVFPLLCSTPLSTGAFRLFIFSSVCTQRPLLSLKRFPDSGSFFRFSNGSFGMTYIKKIVQPFRAPPTAVAFLIPPWSNSGLSGSFSTVDLITTVSLSLPFGRLPYTAFPPFVTSRHQLPFHFASSCSLPSTLSFSC